MSKRSLFTQITAIPKGVTRDAAIAWLHNHEQMIRLNPLVLRLERSTPPTHAPEDEHDCTWYEITDQINYIPGGLAKGEVTYKACFNDLPDGIQTHVYAPAGLELREKWSVGGSEPGEKRKEPRELGLDVPREGLYIKEDVDMRCSIFLTAFVKKNLSKSHKAVLEKVGALADAPTYAAREDPRGAMSSAHSNSSPPRYSTTQPRPGRDVSPTSSGASTPCYCVGQHVPACMHYARRQRPQTSGTMSSLDKPLPDLPPDSGLQNHFHHIVIPEVKPEESLPVDAHRPERILVNDSLGKRMSADSSAGGALYTPLTALIPRGSLDLRPGSFERGRGSTESSGNPSTQPAAYV